VTTAFGLVSKKLVPSETEASFCTAPSDKSQAGCLQIECGYLSPYFVTDPGHMEVVLEDVYIFIHKKRLSSKSDLIPLLEQITESGKPLLIIAEYVRGEALATLVVNKLRGPLQVAAVRAPGCGIQRKRMLQDIALLTGCKFVTEDLDAQLRNIQISDLGQAKKITIDKNCTVIEGQAKYGRPFKPGTCDRWNSHLSLPASASRSICVPPE
jgi:chaperonin GroEL (HSP60 family)